MQSNKAVLKVVKEAIIERLLHNRQITLQEALILLKEIHNHYTYPQQYPYNPPYWPTITYTSSLNQEG